MEAAALWHELLLCNQPGNSNEMLTQRIEMATIDHSSLVTVVAIEGSETATVTKGQQQEK